MKKTLVETASDWTQLVSEWIKGVANEDCELRTTSNYEELAAVLRVPDEAVQKFLARGLSYSTRAYAETLASNSQIRPTTFPAVVLWSFITIPCANDGFIFDGAEIMTVDKNDLNPTNAN